MPDFVPKNVTFLGSKAGNTNFTNDNYNAETSEVPTADISEDPFKDFGDEIALSDDDLPF